MCVTGGYPSGGPSSMIYSLRTTSNGTPLAGEKWQSHETDHSLTTVFGGQSGRSGMTCVCV